MASQDNVSRSEAPNASDSHIALTKVALATRSTA
ncbi:BnaA07g12660D [Brassica napus]|uniref:BnaA07g12660D protein n=1 Tax=Brassica napus TaxID=3708 RepID=A0A078I732_BRANA|nr:BnaA07g12660D [Brassica napus]